MRQTRFGFLATIFIVVFLQAPHAQAQILDTGVGYCLEQKIGQTPTGHIDKLTVSLDTEDDSRSDRLTDQIFKEPSEMSVRIDAYMAEQDIDVDWSPRVEADLTDWFNSSQSESSDLIVADCVADVCAVDFFMPFMDYVRGHSDKAQSWSTTSQGFHPSYLYVAAGDNHIRLYVFRDSFDPQFL